jgi:hypothetical protein
LLPVAVHAAALLTILAALLLLLAILVSSALLAAALLTVAAALLLLLLAVLVLTTLLAAALVALIGHPGLLLVACRGNRHGQRTNGSAAPFPGRFRFALINNGLIVRCRLQCRLSVPPLSFWIGLTPPPAVLAE